MEKLITEFSIGLFFWQSLIFLIILFVLKRYAWKPILSAVKQREETIKGSLEEARKVKKEMADLQSENKKVLKEAYQQRDEILRVANHSSAQIINTAKEEARVEAQKILQNAYSDIEAEKQNALSELKSHVGQIAVLIVGKVLEENLSDQKKQQRLIENLLKDVSLN
ncbi:MAG: F0F1 ATP synthase subunit B [Flavobacteriaceae bacterium]|nr:F0F1 ATP synthase subunit B [Flavobacteriaceae bacterium]MCY4266709.1 F0F1 ATP synthase subunit B [Flavobacteriaceae bacterium]MCY4298945.1 F0F1 ATP synthase subunit B [Flavobacteriaceae bacterium]